MATRFHLSDVDDDLVVPLVVLPEGRLFLKVEKV